MTIFEGIPILSDAQYWFEALWNQVVATAQKAADQVWFTLPEWLRNILLKVRDFVDDVWEDLQSFLEDPVKALADLAGKIWDAMPDWIKKPIDKIKDFAKEVWEGFESFFLNVGQTMFNIGSRVWTLAPDWLKSPLEKVKAFVDDVWKDLQSFLEDPVKALSGLKDKIWDAMPDEIKDAIQSAEKTIKDLSKTLPEKIEAIPGDVKDILDGALAGVGDAIAKIGTPIASALEGLGKSVWENLGEAIRTIAEAMGSLVAEAMAAGSPKWETDIKAGLQDIFERNTFEMGKLIDPAEMPQVPKTPEEAAGLAKRVLDKVGDDVITESINGALWEVFTVGQVEAFERLADILRSVSGFDTLLSGVVQAKLESTILPLLRQYWLSKTTPYIPSASDLIRFFVRESYYPDFKEQYREKFEGIPPHFVDLMKKAGFSEDFTYSYWGAHWLLPGVEQVFEMLHRGLFGDPYSEEAKAKVAAFLKEADLDPRWRKYLTEISFKLPGMIEARWMLEWNIINAEKYKYLLKQNGIAEEWLEQVYQAEKANVFREHIWRVASYLMRYVREGKMTSDQLKTELLNLGYPEEAAGLIVRAAELDRDLRASEDMGEAKKRSTADEMTMIRTQLIYLYLYDRITDEELTTRLTELGFTSEEAKLTLESAKLRKEAMAARRKEPTTQELVADEYRALRTTWTLLYINGLMKKEELASNYARIGLTEEEIKLALENAELRKWREATEEAAQIGITMFRKRRISADELYSYLLSLGYLEEDAKRITQLEVVRALPKPRAPRVAS